MGFLFLRFLSLLFLSFIFLVFFQGCALSNFAECGKGACPSSDLRPLALLGLVYSGSCELPAEFSSGGLQDDPNYYASFSHRISEQEWNETAVRKILHTFAWGGPATDSIVQEWVKMGPSRAIVQILHADPTHRFLNQPVSGNSASIPDQASLYCLTRNLGSGASLLSETNRSGIGLDRNESNARSFPVIAQMRGLNPVRNVLGFMETNYHMATNSALVGPRPQLRMYDEIMNAIARGENYENVLAQAAVSAAIAIQYNHRRNRFIDAQFLGNEDFAREFHQLFFGVLGTGSNSGDVTLSSASFLSHEKETIPETAKALTDIRVGDFNSMATNLDRASYGTDFHLERPIRIYGNSISGSNAKEKIANAARISINNSESLNNLPLKIVRFLADDNLDEEKISGSNPDATIVTKANQIRTLWAETSPKNLLVFLRRYAISSAFHNNSRVKYRTSADRIFTISNLVTLDNTEVSFGLHSTRNLLANEDIEMFAPTHEVFGGQTGLEARDTADIFKSALNTSSETPDHWGLGFRSERGLTVYRKNYDVLIPKNSDGRYRVKEVTEWLWNRFIGDGLKNLGNLERAHIYALLGSGTDLSYFLARDKKDASINTISYGYGDGGTNDIALNPDLVTRIQDASVATIALEDTGDRGNEARRRVGLAINFIVSTPYMFAVEGK